MDEKSLKTSRWQRIIIIVVAILLIGSTMLTYMFVVMSNGKSTSSVSSSTDSQIEELTAAYDAKSEELEVAAEPFSEQYFPVLKPYLSEVKAYNEQSATDGILATKDLLVGTGRELTEGDTDYLAYYVGWCASGDIFDSSLDATEIADATALRAPIDPSGGLIEGWEQGIVGTKLGGVRMITMNGDLAYGESREICDGYNKPLRFLVLPIERATELSTLNQELQEIYQQLYAAYLTSVGY